MDNALYDIPDSWKWVTLDDIGIVVSGGTPSTKEPEYWNGDVPWITPADLSNYDNVYISKGARNITSLGLEYSSANLLPKDSIVFSSRAPIGYVAITKNELATNQGFKNLIIWKDLINPKYVYYFLHTIKDVAENLASGTTFLELSASKFKQLPFPLTIIDEQNQIVNKVEELFSVLDNSLSQLNESLSKSLFLKQKILDNIIIKNNSAYIELNALTESIDYGFASKSYKLEKTNSIHYLRITDIQNGEINWANVPYCNIEDKQIVEKYSLKENDILFARSGNTVGKSILLSNVPNSIYASYLIRIRCKNALLDAKFLAFFMQTSYYWKQINEGVSGIGQPNFNGTKLANMLVPYLDIESQQEAVDYVESNFIGIDKLISEIRNSITRIKILKSQILKYAYTGKLINETADYNIDLVLKMIQEKKNKYHKELIAINKTRKKPQKAKVNLHDVISKNFKKEVFSYSELYKHVKFSKSVLKMMFEELEMTNKVISYFDEKSGTIKYKLV
ncbi:restriction endonuclease subunit S [Chryseobacterium sp.]|uniref:restriction endonuclease subunit S n=1 Tax=Chryseobacterium sp. TaxID=1871047 RepID=UPI00289FE8F1|nr:restriction endonuclease subunit S [Chryseobacterium sp.]